MIDKRLLQKRFSRNAVNYDAHANVQKKMAYELIEIVKSSETKWKDGMSILDIGCGTGYLTEQLIELFPSSHITAIDIAPGMIEIAREKFSQRNVTFICEDIEEVELTSKYDLIVSNAAFQWFNQLDKTLIKLYSLLNNKGIICFSTFGSSTFDELHQSFKMAQKVLGITTKSLPGQRFYSYADLYKLCQDTLTVYMPAEFSITGKETFECEYFASVKAFFESVKKIGANNSNQKQNTNLAITKEMIKIYEQDFMVEDKVKATYHFVFFTIKN